MGLRVGRGPCLMPVMRLSCFLVLSILAQGAAGGAFAGDVSIEEEEFVRRVLGLLQVKSALENREYCGYIGVGPEGDLVATEAVSGNAVWCDAPWPEGLEVIASYHTHGAFDPNAWSEIPSGRDMETDQEEGIDGYLGTPGGRLWYIDSSEMAARQLCGIGCLPQAPGFYPIPEDNILERYTYDELVEKIGGG